MKSHSHIPDLYQTQAFLDALDPDGIFTFQTFDDKGKQNSSLARVFHGTLKEHADALTRLQQQGAGAFVMVSKGDGVIHSGNQTCRTTSNVIAVRALFADLDGSPLEPLLKCCKPDIIIESSPSKWHCYYLTSDCPLSEFSQRQKQIAQKFNSDPKVCDLPRVMRLPGFWHQKAEPFMSRIVSQE